LWSTSTLQQEGTAFRTPEGAASTAAFEPGSGNLLVIDEHGNGFTWPASLADLEDRACAIAGRSLTRKEWTRYLGDQPYAPACS
jgi:hypothetical protein